MTGAKLWSARATGRLVALVALAAPFTASAEPAAVGSQPVASAPQTSAPAAPPDAMGTGTQGIRGYFDAASGTFQTLEPDAGASNVTSAGTVHIVGSVALNSAITTSTPVGAYVSVLAAGSYFITATVTAKRTAAQTASFDVSVPYTLVVPSGAVPVSVSVYYSAYTTANGTLTNWTSNSLSSATLPANGKTLTVNVRGAL